MLPRLGSLVPGPMLPITQRWRPSANSSAASRASSPAMLVDLERAVGEVELAQRDRRAAEGVGLHHVGAGGEIAAMDFAHQVGARQVQHVGAVLPAPVVASRHPASAPARGCPCRRRTAARGRAGHRADGDGSSRRLSVQARSSVASGGGVAAARDGATRCAIVAADPAMVDRGRAGCKPGSGQQLVHRARRRSPASDAPAAAMIVAVVRAPGR